MQVKVNGKVETLSETIDVTSFLSMKSLVPERVVVELNGDILKREMFGSTELSDGDVVEIVHFVGGG